MFRKSFLSLAIFFLALPALAVTPDDLDLSAFPDDAEVLEIAQDAEGVPLRLCARPVRQRFIRLEGPPTILWFKVPLKAGADHRYDVEGVTFVWVKIIIPGTPGSDYTVEKIECVRKCPQDAADGRCVNDPKVPCPICVK